jgi:hypothetical protein
MTSRARHFRLTALHAQHALASQRPSTARGRRAKALAIGAFRDYALVGREWVLTGRARLHGNRAAATTHARLASRYAKKGNSLLLGAGRLLH